MNQEFPGIPYRSPAYEAPPVHGTTAAAAPAAGGAVPAARTAPFFRRVIAFVMDLMIVEFLATLLGSVAAAARAVVALGMNPALWEGARQDATLFTAQMTPLFLFAYFTFFTAYGGRTPGKMAFALKVVAADGGDAGGWRCVWRTVCYLASVVTWGMGFLMAAGPAGRALHDRLAGTRVVMVPRPARTPASPR
jgi:uncharacterized RDD family membrane protein YckC